MRFRLVKGAILLMAFMMSACTYQSEQKPPPGLTDAERYQLRVDVQAIGDRCRALRQSGRLRGYAASVSCSNPAILAAYERVNYLYPSVLNYVLARRVQLAERADAKAITEGDMLVALFTDAEPLPAMTFP
jgi:hypothetical protein